MSPLKINFWAIGLCVIINMVIRTVWYSLFSGPWMDAHELTVHQVEERTIINLYLIDLIANLISMYVLAWLYSKLQVESPVRGALIGLLFAIAFFSVVNYTNNAFSLDPFKLSLIDGGAIMISWTVSGAILGVWSIRHITP